MFKFLVIQTAFIGDAILASACIEELHKSHPTASIDFLVRKGNEQLFEHHPFLNKVLIWNKQEHKLHHFFKTLQRIRKEKYTHVINIHRYTSSGLFTVLSGAKETIGFDKNPLSFLFTKKIKHRISAYGDTQWIHETERNHELIAAITSLDVQRPKLYPSEQDYAKVAAYKNQPYICIAPSSVWFTKQFPVAKWIDFVKTVPKHFTIYLLGGKGDHALAESIAEHAKGKCVNLCGTLSLLASAALMQDAFMNYVNDSGPLHLCSATNAPTRAIFCSTQANFGFGPLSTDSKIIAYKEHLACKPCGLHGKKECPKAHFTCALGIDINELSECLTA